jgi:IS605 OrfB family transposase
MLVGRRYRLELTLDQAAYAEQVGGICRAVWNAALEQRRAAFQLNRGRTADRAVWPSYASQCRELAEAKRTETWLADAPSHCLQQTLRDLDRVCRQHGVWRVHWRSKRRWEAAFRFPDPAEIGEARRLGRHAGEVRLPKLGAVRFRWSRPLGGVVRNATVQRSGRHWYIAFCVEDGVAEAAPNGKPAVGIDCGVVVPVATSDGQYFGGLSMRSGEQRRLAHLQRRLARQKRGSNRRHCTVRTIKHVFERIRSRRLDFAHQTAHVLTICHGLVVIEDLRVRNMTASARGTLEEPGTNVRQKSGLNRAILDKAWGQLRTTLEWHGRKHGCGVVAVPAAYTSQTCSACGHVAAESRESQARFCCCACGVVEHADVNAAKNILAAGLAASGRGGHRVAVPMKRQPLERSVAYVTAERESPAFRRGEEVKRSAD